MDMVTQRNARFQLPILDQPKGWSYDVGVKGHDSYIGHDFFPKFCTCNSACYVIESFAAFDITNIWVK